MKHVPVEIKSAQWRRLHEEEWRSVAFAVGSLHIPKDRTSVGRTVALNLSDRDDYVVFRKLYSDREEIYMRVRLLDGSEVEVRSASVWVSDTAPFRMTAAGHVDPLS